MDFLKSLVLDFVDDLKRGDKQAIAIAAGLVVLVIVLVLFA